MPIEGDADEDGFGGERDAERVADPVPDLPGQRQQRGGAGRAGVDQGERVLGRDPGAVARVVALAEPGLLDQPGRGYLGQAVSRLEVRHPGLRPAPGPGGRLHRGQRGRVQHRVDEERADAAGVGVGGVDDHSLALPELDDRRAGLGALHLAADGDAEGGSQLGVADRSGQHLHRQPERDAQHDEPPGAAEPAGPVAEIAPLVRYLMDVAGHPVVDPHRRDRLGDFLAVGADVLDRGGPGEPGDAGQALEAGQPLGHAPGDHRVPVLAGRHGQRARSAVPADAARRDLDHGAVEPLVGDDKVAAAAQDQQRLAGHVGGPHRVDELVLGSGPDEAAGWAAEADRGVIRQLHGRRTTACARVSTFASPDRAVMSTATWLPSSLPVTTPAISTWAPLSSSGTTTGVENLTPNSVTAAGSPAQSVRYRPASAIVSMPCAITSGRPTDVAIRWFQWMGLKSPEAPACRTRAARVAWYCRDAISAPSLMSWKPGLAIFSPTRRVRPGWTVPCRRARRPRSGSR